MNDKDVERMPDTRSWCVWLAFNLTGKHLVCFPVSSVLHAEGVVGSFQSGWCAKSPKIIDVSFAAKPKSLSSLSQLG